MCHGAELDAVFPAYAASTRELRTMNEPQPREPITAADLSEYLASQDDFAFEREVYHVAKRLGFAAEHAALYTDPVTDKPRQFDVRASFTLGNRQIALAIECKGLSASYPLLVSCVPRSRNEAFHEHLVADNVMGQNTSYTRVSTVLGGQFPMAYEAGQPVGKSMRQVRRDARGNKRGELTSGDDVFDKWMQALASIADLVDAVSGMGAGFIMFNSSVVPCLRTASGVRSNCALKARENASCEA